MSRVRATRSALIPLLPIATALSLFGCAASATPAASTPGPGATATATAPAALAPSAPPTNRVTPEPTLPLANSAPPAPTGLTAATHAAPCPGETVIGKFPCLVADLVWVPARADAIYRIYATWSGEGVGAACAPTEALLIATSLPNATAITVGPLEPTTGGGVRCLYVAAVNSAGESARAQFTSDFVSP